MKTGLNLIEEEFQNLKLNKYWTNSHNDALTEGELAEASACYSAFTAGHQTLIGVRNGMVMAGNGDIFPFDKEWDNRKDNHKIKNLQIAGALIALEIERLQRMQNG